MDVQSDLCCRPPPMTMCCSPKLDRLPQESEDFEMTRSLLPYRTSLAGTLLAAREAAMAPMRHVLREEGLTDQQWRVLRILIDESGIDPTRLAHAALLQPPSVTRIIRDMAARGLIERQPDPAGQRRSILRVLPEGERIFARVSKNAARVLDLYDDYFGHKRLDALRRELIELTAVLTRLKDEGGPRS